MTTDRQIEYDSWALALGWEDDDYDDDPWAYLDDEIEDPIELWPEEVELVDEHASRRDAKRAKVTGMQVSGRSIKSVLLPTIEKRGREARRKETRRAS